MTTIYCDTVFYAFDDFKWQPARTQVIFLGPINSLDILAPMRHCKYGGEDEYYVEVRETGNFQQEKVDTESSVERTQDTPPLDFASSFFRSKDLCTLHIEHLPRPLRLAGKWTSYPEGCWCWQVDSQSTAYTGYGFCSCRWNQPGKILIPYLLVNKLQLSVWTKVFKYQDVICLLWLKYIFKSETLVHSPTKTYMSWTCNDVQCANTFLVFCMHKSAPI